MVYSVCLTSITTLWMCHIIRLSTLFIWSMNIPKLFQDQWIGEKSDISDVTGQFGLYSWCVGRWDLVGTLWGCLKFILLLSATVMEVSERSASCQWSSPWAQSWRLSRWPPPPSPLYQHCFSANTGELTPGHCLPSPLLLCKSGVRGQWDINVTKDHYSNGRQASPFASI